MILTGNSIGIEGKALKKGASVSMELEGKDTRKRSKYGLTRGVRETCSGRLNLDRG